MPRRRVLTEAQLETLFALPTSEADLALHWTLSPADHAAIQGRRGDHNRLGFTLQLGSSAESVVQAARSTRRRSRANLARPKVCRFSSFSLFTCPSVCPLLQGVVSAAFTAAPSCCRPAAKVATADTPLFSASLSQALKVVIGARTAALPLRLQPRTRSANRRTSAATVAASASCSRRA